MIRWKKENFHDKFVRMEPQSEWFHICTLLIADMRKIVIEIGKLGIDKETRVV